MSDYPPQGEQKSASRKALVRIMLLFAVCAAIAPIFLAGSYFLLLGIVGTAVVCCVILSVYLIRSHFYESRKALYSALVVFVLFIFVCIFVVVYSYRSKVEIVNNTEENIELINYSYTGFWGITRRGRLKPLMVSEKTELVCYSPLERLHLSIAWLSSNEDEILYIDESLPVESDTIPKIVLIAGSKRLR